MQFYQPEDVTQTINLVVQTLGKYGYRLKGGELFVLLDSELYVSPRNTCYVHCVTSVFAP